MAHLTDHLFHSLHFASNSCLSFERFCGWFHVLPRPPYPIDWSRCPLILLSDFLNHNASRRQAVFPHIGSVFPAAIPTFASLFNSDRVFRRKFLNTSISGLFSRSSIRLDSQTFNMIWHNLVTVVNFAWLVLGFQDFWVFSPIRREFPPKRFNTCFHVRLRLWCVRQGCSKPSSNFHVVVTVSGCGRVFPKRRVSHFRSRHQHQAAVTTSVAFQCLLRRRRKTAIGTVTIKYFSLPPCVPVLSR